MKRLGRRIGLGILALAGSTACASAPVAKPAPYQVGTSSAPPSLPPASSPLSLPGNSAAPPVMGSGQPSIVGTPSARINLSATNEDVASVIGRVASQVGLSTIIDPAVKGTVTRVLQNATLNEAMLSVVGTKYQYQVRNGALIVSPIQLVQRTYTVDYLAMSRVSTGSTLVSRGTQSGPLSAAGNVQLMQSGPTSGSDAIVSSSQTDVWGELTQQLESILFGGPGESARAQAGVAARGYSRCEGQVCLRISPITSLVDVTATPDKQEEINRYVSLFSAAISRQVLIKAQVVEVTLDRSHSFGIDWQAVLSLSRGVVRGTLNNNDSFNPDASTVTGGRASFNLGFGDFTLQAVLSALQSVGDVQVVAKPMTNALNQQKASFNVTRQEQFFNTVRAPVLSATTGLPTGAYTESQQLQTATVGLVFDVLPQISDKNVIMMAIRPSVTSIASRTQITAADGTIQAIFPVTEHRESDTMARVRSGETIMIGGLIQKQTSTTRTGFPILMNIPVLGRAFSSTKVQERNTELVIFLTPEIISGQPPGSP